MKFTATLSRTLCLTLGAMLPLAGCNSTDSLRQVITQIDYTAKEKVFPALVNIEATTQQIYNGQQHKGLGTGSGSIISKQGYIITNAHVVDNGISFLCTLSDNQEIPATLVGTDPLTDIAVLKLDLSKEKNQGKNLPVATFSDSDTLQSADAVMAMGSPLSLSKSISRGVVSNTQRILMLPDQAMAMPNKSSTGFLTIWIQHDALINPGNSGGPLVNLKGQIVGINARGGSNMGFAIPANQAKRIAHILIKHGTVARSWIGASLKTTKKTGHTHGVLVNSVVEKSPAAIADLQPGDLITHINGQAVNAANPIQIPPLLNLIANTHAGQTLSLTVNRFAGNGQSESKTKSIRIKTLPLPTKFGKQAALRKWGMTALEITPWMAQLRQLKSTDGVIVRDIASGSVLSLAKPPINAYAIITQIGDRKIKNITDMISAYESLTKTYDPDKRAIVHYTTRRQNRITLIKTQHDKDEDSPRDIPKSWVGIATQPVLKKLADQLTGQSSQGFLITRIYKDTQAYQSQLKVGDIITHVNDVRVLPRSIQDYSLFERQIRMLEDEQVTLHVQRSGKKLAIKVELEFTKTTSGQAKTDQNRDFDLTVRAITFFDRADNYWDKSMRGVIVTNVGGAGWAGRAGIRSYDLIQKVGDYKTSSIKSYRKAMKKISAKQPKRIIIQILRGMRKQFIYIEPQWSPNAAADQKSVKK